MKTSSLGKMGVIEVVYLLSELNNDDLGEWGFRIFPLVSDKLFLSFI